MADSNAQRNASPYFLGEHEYQAGKKKGIKSPVLFLIANEAATKIGLPKGSGFPQTVGGVTYSIKNRAVFAEGTRTKDGVTTNFDRLVRVGRGSKPLTLYLTTDEAYTYKQQGVTVTGRRPKTVQIGVPQTATAKMIEKFFKNAANVASFSLGGGIYPILRGAQ